MAIVNTLLRRECIYFPSTRLATHLTRRSLLLSFYNINISSIQAGHHTFPFQLELPATLPASMTSQLLGASTYYELRATAIRTAFSANYYATKPICLLKSFSPEALEYNQSPEIEVC
jgi:hypothetical protein